MRRASVAGFVVGGLLVLNPGLTPAFGTPPSINGATVTAGGGIGDFVDDTVSSATGRAGSWSLRTTYGTRVPVAGELAYIGAANDVRGTGIEDDAFLLSSTVEGALRFNVPLVLGNASMAEPFGLVGLGWTRYSLINAAQAPGRMTGTDNQLIVPLGVGIGYCYRWLTADVRFTYRFAFEDNMFGEADMGTWNAALNLGVEF